MSLKPTTIAYNSKIIFPHLLFLVVNFVQNLRTKMCPENFPAEIVSHKIDAGTTNFPTAGFTSGIQGCQIFLGKYYPNRKKCTKWSYNIPNVCKIFQMAIKYINIFQSRGPPKFTQIGIFGLKRNHLATLPA
jgi:hypothetical protein